MAGDAAEQRLKTEVMQLPARDRRRLKEVPDVSHGANQKERVVRISPDDGYMLRAC